MTALGVLCAAVPAVSALLGTSNAMADDAHGQVNVQRWQPAVGADNWVTIETTRMSKDTPLFVGLYVDYAHDPFRLRTCAVTPCTSSSGEQHLSVLHDLEVADLMVGWTPFDRLQLSLRAPIGHVSGSGVVTDASSPSYGQAQPGGISGTTLGDPELEAKVRVIGSSTSVFSAGVAGTLSAPLSHAMDKTLYMGDATFTPGFRAIADVRAGRFFAAANVGAAFRSSAHIGSLDLGSELRYGIGGGVKVSDTVRILTEFFASTNFASASGTNAAELDFAAQYAPKGSQMLLTLGGGPGLNEGFGAPAYRIFVGAGFTFGHGAAGAASADGPVDTDHDGIPDAADKCPTEGGDVIRVAGPYYGCRPHDADGDGVPDHVDACAATPGSATGDPRTNGCPSDDRDKDGIPNDKDKCPDQPETYNGFEDEDGCPDVQPAISVQIQSDRIVVLNERVEFEKNSDQIKDPRFFQALDLVAQAMKEHPEIRQVEVSGHADITGTPEFNVALSKRRALTVIEYLATHGVARDRLVANAHGASEPAAANETDDGRAQNRRVQFKILAMSK